LPDASVPLPGALRSSGTSWVDSLTVDADRSLASFAWNAKATQSVLSSGVAVNSELRCELLARLESQIRFDGRLTNGCSLTVALLWAPFARFYSMWLQLDGGKQKGGKFIFKREENEPDPFFSIASW
jgi:hypothetical protein